MVKKTLAHGPSHDSAVLEDRLEVQGLPDGPGFDVVLLEGEAHLLSGSTEGLGINDEASEPAGASSVWGFGHELNTW